MDSGPLWSQSLVKFKKFIFGHHSGKYELGATHSGLNWIQNHPNGNQIFFVEISSSLWLYMKLDTHNWYFWRFLMILVISSSLLLYMKLDAHNMYFWRFLMILVIFLIIFNMILMDN